MKAKELNGLWKGRFVAVSTTLLIVLAGGVALVQTAHSDDPDLPTPTVPLHDQQTLAANDAKTNAGEQADEQTLEDARKGLLGTPQPKDGSFSPSDIPIYTDPPPSVGIDNAPTQGAGWASLYRITNEWYGVINSNNIIADAGSKTDDIERAVWNTPEQGVLIVTGNGNGEYLTPTRTGQVRITSYSGTCLTLLSTSNTTYQFDLATRQWSCQANQQPAP